MHGVAVHDRGPACALKDSPPHDPRVPVAGKMASAWSGSSLKMSSTDATRPMLEIVVAGGAEVPLLRTLLWITNLAF